MSRLDETCPRCGTARQPAQEYCIACGLRLPRAAGGFARFRRGWVDVLGWYPGDWVWTTLLLLVVAAAGAAVAIGATRSDERSGAGRTIVATDLAVPLAAPSTPAATPTAGTSTLPTPPEPPGDGSAGAPAPAKNGETPWPAGQTGWSVVLVSLPATKRGSERARAQARRAVRAGLPEVGVLVSSRYASLHPGYFVVFAGVYEAQAEARSSLSAAREAGFPSAYVRQITQ